MDVRVKTAYFAKGRPRIRLVREEIDEALVVLPVLCGQSATTLVECSAIALRLIKAESAKAGLVLYQIRAWLQPLGGAMGRIENLKRAISTARRPLERRAAGTKVEGLDPARRVRPSELREQLTAIAV